MVAGAGSCSYESDIPSQRGSFSLLARLGLQLLPVMTRSRLKTVDQGQDSKNAGLTWC